MQYRKLPNGLYSIEMDPRKCREACKDNATILLLDIPELTVISLDGKSFSVTSLFKGFKMIPPGAHVLYTRAADRFGNQFAPTVGQFIYLAKNQVEVRRWDSELEELEKISDEDTNERYKQGVINFDFDSGLAPYDFGSNKSWNILTRNITQEIIDKISPLNHGKISILFEESNFDIYNPKTKAEEDLAKQLNNSPESKDERIEKKGKNCFYTLIPTLVKERSLSASELTYANIDKTKLLENIISSNFNSNYVLFLGEYQFSFLAFWLCHSLEGFNQWKRMTILVLECIEAPFQKFSALYINLIDILINQLSTYENAEDSLISISDIMEGDDKGGNNFLKRSVLKFLNNMRDRMGEEEVIDINLNKQFDDLEEMVLRKFGWKLCGDLLFSSDDEEAPVIVEI